MFEKLVSGLPYSPALVGQLGFYARRLKKEEVTRRTGLVFTALALVVQSFAVFSPPEPANASSPSDMIRGGVSSVEQIISIYDQSANGNGDFKAIMDYNGISRADLQGLRSVTVNSRQFGTGSDAILSWGRVARFSSAQGEVKHVIPLVNNDTSTVFSRPLWRFDSTNYTVRNGSSYLAFTGTTANGKWFGIMKDCGNLMTRSTPNPHPAGSVIAATCQTVRGFAYDARQRDGRVAVYLYFNGPPGSGERVGPLLANETSPTSPVGNGYGFNANVPSKYTKLGTPVTVYGVMIPLAGWNQSSVQIGQATIPGNCSTPPVASAACSNVKTRMIERTKYNFVATAALQNGASIRGYVFTVKDASGKIVQQKSVRTAATTAESGTLDLKNAGRFTVNVTVQTSIGDKTSGSCDVGVTVAPLEKCPYNAELIKTHPDCKPCPGNPQIWIKNKECAAELVQGKEVKNLTQNIVNANGTTVKQGDRLEYTVYMENVGSIETVVKMDEELADVIEYASLQDNGSGTFNDQTKVLSWGSVTLKPGEKQARKFVVQVNQIPATPQGTSEPGSYDCIMSNVYGNTVTVRVDCPLVKGVEQTVKELPSTGVTTNVIFGAGLLALTTYFYARNRQLSREIRLIRHDFNSGTL